MKNFFAFLLVFSIGLGTFTACDGSDYKKALKLMESGSYEEAKSIFSEISDYKDSAEFIEECDYQIAVGLMNNGEYDKAKSIFSEITDYKDSTQLIIDCNWQIVIDYLCNHDVSRTEQLDGLINSLDVVVEDERQSIRVCIVSSADDDFIRVLNLTLNPNEPNIAHVEFERMTLLGKPESDIGVATVELSKYYSSELNWEFTFANPSATLLNKNIVTMGEVMLSKAIVYFDLILNKVDGGMGMTFEDLGINEME